MSDSMEQEKAELLTAKEREEKEEMKRELLDMKMYETWYTYKDMKQILGFINESKDMANMADEKNAQKELMQSSNDCGPDMIPKTNLAQELDIQEHNDSLQSIHSYRINHASPIHERISTHGCSSPSNLSPAIAELRNSPFRGKNLDNEDMFIRLQDHPNMRDSYSHSMSKYISLKSQNSLQDSDILSSTETRVDTHSECDQKLERWQINPLDSCVVENDVPLREPNRPLVQDRMPFRLCKDAQTPETLEKLLPALNFHLKQTAELWHSWHRTDTKFQWGSPIQVGHSKDNSDKKPLTNIKTEHNQMELINKHSNERPSKRKSTLILSLPDTKYSSSDEDEHVFKKKKILSPEGTSKMFHSNKVICEKDVRKLFDNIETDYKTESPDIISLRHKKMTTPNVRKYINKKREHNIEASPLAHSSNEKQSAIHILSRDKSNVLPDEEILIELEKDNANENDKTTSENAEIKPLPIKRLSRRIKNECMILEKIQLEKQKKLEVEKEEAQKREYEERKKKEEFYKKQLEERQRREKKREEKEKYKEEQSKKWNNLVDIKSQKRINKEDTQMLQGLNKRNEVRTSEIIEDKMFEQNNIFVTEEMEIMKNNLINNINCPICNKYFPNDEIEAHAAECEQYMSDNECESNLHSYERRASPVNINNTVVLECGVCTKYKTTNGIDYEEHVNNCIQRQYEDKSINEYPNNQIDNIPNSPVRCFQPISEQTDSHIDYKKQFPSNSKKQVHSNRKRKR